MRRFLVVGCGGSGGATLRFLMDQLSAELADHGVHELPAAWQFVHIDVPTQPDSGPGLLRSVRDQGGRYQSISYPGARYQDVAAQVDARLESGEAISSLASWRPEPSEVTFPITDGAGQYRAVGRVLTLAQMKSRILPDLVTAWSALSAAGVNQEMKSLVDEAKIPGLGQVEPDAAPLVLVVSSMAGGAGASMVLDVCDLLGTIQGVQPGNIGVFLFTPDVFEGLAPHNRPGVEANAAATMAELIAAQTQATSPEAGESAQSDPHGRVLSALGLQPGPATKPFGRVFPIGRRIGGVGAVLGSGDPDTVYRALGRGLAALMGAGDATERFAARDLTNVQADGRRDDYGWGNTPNSVGWGSFGFASLSLGRDRYAEYSAQRIARTAMDRLATGHRQSGDDRQGYEQVRALVDQRLPHFCSSVGLPAPTMGPKNWFGQHALPAEQLRATAHSIRSEVIDPVLGDKTRSIPNVEQWFNTTQSRVTRQRNQLDSSINDAAQRWGITWYERLRAEVEREIADSIAMLGLPYAIALLQRLISHLEWLAEELRRAAAQQPAVSELPKQTRDAVAPFFTGKLTDPGGVIDLVRAGYQQNLESAFRLRSAALAAELLGSMGMDMVRPLEDACRRALSEIERARAAHPTDVGLAQLRTNTYASWPADDDETVPGRFAHAENEVLLTTSSDFSRLYESHLLAADPSDAAATARERVSRQVISGLWPTVGGQPSPGGLIEARAQWRPPAIALDPETGAAISASRANYDVHLAPADVLGRARTFISRPQQAFSAYSGESLHDYVSDPSISEGEREDRVRLVADKFAQVLDLARPLVGVSVPAIRHLHENAQRQYKFSAIPFEGLDVADRLEKVLEHNNEIDDTAATSFRSVLTGESPTSRIDVFGSYPTYFPVVFTSILEPIAARWSALSPHQRAEFWKWRRARPLPAALPVGKDQRRAMVAGWLVGQAVGMLRVPADAGAPGARAVEVYDPDTSTWCAFPRELVVDRSQYRATADVLAALLETMTLALAKCFNSADQAPLRPYSVLRRLYDRSQDGPLPGQGLEQPVAGSRIHHWIQTGEIEPGAAVPQQLQGLSTPEQRTQAVLAWLKGSREAITRLQQETSLDGLDARPRIVDLATDVVWATHQLEHLVTNPPARSDDGRNRPLSGELGF